MSASPPVAPTPNRYSRGASRILTLLVLILAAGGGWWWSHRAQTADAATSAGAGAPAGGRKDGGRGGAGGGGRGPLPSVVVAPARKLDFDVWADSLGTVTPISNVTIHTRVDGPLLHVNFREAQIVHAGDLLAEIDPRPFQVTVDQDVATQLRDQALLDNARIDLKRYQDLAATDAIPHQQLDTQLSLVHQYEATVATDKAVADSARLQLSFCRIESPITGQIGLRLIDPGNMVHASDTGGLVTVAQIDPISVLFTLPQDLLPSIQAHLRAHETVKLQALDRNGKSLLGEGTLFSLDNQIDATTGTIKLRGLFSNGRHQLYPSQFVNLRALLETRHGAIVAPSSAVQRGPAGTFMYVLKDDKTVTMRNVSLGPSDKGRTVVDEGLAENERVVVDGADKLSNGATVTLAKAAQRSGADPAGAGSGAGRTAGPAAGPTGAPQGGGSAGQATQ